MTKAIRIHETGNASVLKYEDIEIGRPKAGQVLIDQKAVGLNFIDIYFRTGLYPIAEFPFIPGMEGAGDVLAVGRGVSEFKPGDRVAYGSVLGAYTQQRIIEADRLVKIPKGIGYDIAASVMLKGMTAQYLLRRTFRVKKGHVILIHAAAGGVGSIATQWANALGATVIGTVGSKEKVRLAKTQGCHHVINYNEKNFVDEVRRITKKEGVDVVYDSVGKDTYPGSLDCLKPFGTWVSFGQSSGALPGIDLGILAQKGSLFATRPTLLTYVAKHDDLVKTARDLFKVIGDGTVKVKVSQQYPLKNAAQAHRDLQGRKTTGATILVP